MTIEEFWDLEITTAAVAVNALINDQSTLLGAAAAGFSYPLSYQGLWMMMAAASIVNLGSTADTRIMPEWPISKTESSENPIPIDVSDEEMERLKATLNRFSAIQTKKPEETPTTE